MSEALDGGFVYLASPYFHHDPFIRERRFLAVMQATRHYSLEGFCIYSPIVHWHQIALVGAMPKEAAFWEAQNKGMLSRAAELWVLQIDGWSESQGIKKETKWAEEWKIPVRYK
jgi:hypothetical protein